MLHPQIVSLAFYGLFLEAILEYLRGLEERDVLQTVGPSR
jgi:hypothetical protein